MSRDTACTFKQPHVMSHKQKQVSCDELIWAAMQLTLLTRIESTHAAVFSNVLSHCVQYVYKNWKSENLVRVKEDTFDHLY